MISRLLQRQIVEWMFAGKILTIYGPRQVGKTTLVAEILRQYPEKKILSISGDESSVRDMLKPLSSQYLGSIIGNAEILAIDEAQRISEIGLIVKIIHDAFPALQIILTGSSTLDLHSKISEPLTGRNIEFRLFPLSLVEISNNAFDASSHIQTMLQWGSYPDVFTRDITQKKILLQNLTDQYLYRDVLEHGGIQKPPLLKKLLQMLAFQIGSEVSFSELSNALGIDSKTVEKYIDLLEKSFVIFALSSFSRNLRNEIKKSRKYYFYDLGVRNALIENFLDLDIRNDKGGVFENFVILERWKHHCYSSQRVHQYFWRTHQQKEIDLLEESNGNMHSFEIKYSNTATAKPPKEFIKAYPNSSFQIITPASLYPSLFFL